MRFSALHGPHKKKAEPIEADTDSALLREACGLSITERPFRNLLAGSFVHFADESLRSARPLRRE